jgi:hypothetical protein
MTTLEWILIAVIVLLVIILIPCVLLAVFACQFMSVFIPKLPSKSLWQTIVDELHRFVGH